MMDVVGGKILFYCHNLFGLGHVARSLKLAREALALGLDCLMVTGCRYLDTLGHLPAGLEVVRLPPVHMKGGLLVGVDGSLDMITTRGRLILAATRSFQPHVLVSDHSALGLGGELVDTLLAARQERWPAKFYWGVRDVVRESEGGLAPPRNPRLRQALETYHGVMVYSEPHWLDGLQAYRGFPLPEEHFYTGVIGPYYRDPVPLQPGLVAVLAGGGTDGRRLFELLASALQDGLLPESVRLRWVLGPFGEDSPSLSPNLASRVEIWSRGAAEDALADASLAVCRAGYNTAYAAVAGHLPVIFVPLYNEGGEQWLRARRLAELDGVSLVDERAPEAASLLAQAIVRGLALDSVPRTLPFGLDGAKRAACWLAARAAGKFSA